MNIAVYDLTKAIHPWVLSAIKFKLMPQKENGTAEQCKANVINAGKLILLLFLDPNRPFQRTRNCIPTVIFFFEIPFCFLWKPFKLRDSFADNLLLNFGKQLFLTMVSNYTGVPIVGGKQTTQKTILYCLLCVPSCASKNEYKLSWKKHNQALLYFSLYAPINKSMCT